ncbi:hypothetical protein GCM10023169_02630 [Georgenia halophila]|uniref:Uncharacterized protein n=1 Tax=Georgenia halophila TaxID=620889 RepID=A0ABP8KT45_9MICO
MESTGFIDVNLRGLEGPNVGALELLPDDPHVVQLGIDLAERAESLVLKRGGSLDELAEHSPHIMAMGYRGRHT